MSQAMVTADGGTGVGAGATVRVAVALGATVGEAPGVVGFATAPPLPAPPPPAEGSVGVPPGVVVPPEPGATPCSTCTVGVACAGSYESATTLAPVASCVWSDSLPS